MNIFVLDTDHAVNATYHCDKHVIKMVLESAQLLCGVHRYYGQDAPYKLSHANHPCAIWTRQCLDNYEWLTRLAYALCFEYTYRYNGRIHKSQSVIEWCAKNRPTNLIKLGQITPFALCMPIEYQVENDAVASYRLYYIYEKANIATWRKRDVPYWF